MEGTSPIFIILCFLVAVTILACGYALLSRSAAVLGLFRPYWSIMDSRDRRVFRILLGLAGLALAAGFTYFWWRTMSSTLELPQ